MLIDREKHKFTMVQILKEIYSDIEISSLLGFKGGTAAFLFYDLPRFSVDLDFDLLKDSEENRVLIFDKVEKILLKYGEIKDSQKKFSTIFFSLSYEFGQRQIKVEINTRNTGVHYGMLNYLGVAMLVAEKESMLAGKLMALAGRKVFTARDLFDVQFFLKKNWVIEKDVLSAYGVGSLVDYLEKCIALIEKVSEDKILLGLGELIDEKQKNWVKNDLKKDALFLLRLAVDNEKRK